MRDISIPMESATYPWNKTLAQRLRDLVIAYKSGFRIVVYLYEKDDNSTFRYRVYNPCQAMLASSSWRGLYFFGNELDTLSSHIDLVNCFVAVRYRWDEAIANFRSKVARKGKAFLFDTDDLVFDLDMLPVLANTLGKRLLQLHNEDIVTYWFAYISRINHLAKTCEGYICTNDYLARRLRAYYDKPVYIMPNFLNHEQLDISRVCRELKANTPYKPPFIIAYFSGTPSHRNDLYVALPALLDLLQNRDDISLRVMGFMEFPPECANLLANGRIEFRPFCDFRKLQAEIASVDVNIAPLVENQFTNCKSELKFFEAAAVNTVTCATPTHSFAKAIRHEETGYLCSPGDWSTMIEQLYSKGVPPSLIDNAREYCLDMYSPEGVLPQIEKLFESI